jgi:hypothetical protein
LASGESTRTHSTPWATNPQPEAPQGGASSAAAARRLNLTHRATTEHGLGTLEQQQPANRHWPCRLHEPPSPYPPRPEQQHQEITHSLPPQTPLQADDPDIQHIDRFV